MAARFRPEALTLAVSLIALGVAWTLGNLGQMDTLYAVRRWWPMSLLLWGVLELVGSFLDRQERRPS
jgi:hypothetical protein